MGTLTCEFGGDTVQPVTCPNLLLLRCLWPEKEQVAKLKVCFMQENAMICMSIPSLTESIKPHAIHKWLVFSELESLCLTYFTPCCPFQGFQPYCPYALPSMSFSWSTDHISHYESAFLLILLFCPSLSDLRVPSLTQSGHLPTGSLGRDSMVLRSWLPG